MAQTLEEFLVNVKYTIDQPSQQNFLNNLKRVASSIGGVTTELVGLSVGLVEITKKLAQHGDALYWASQRLNTSIAAIQGASFAMANLGVSTSEAQSAMERFGSWQRSMGAAATGFMRTLGVTATETDLQLEQLGRRLSAMGANRPGTTAYAIALQYAQMMGLDERQMRAIADPRYAQYAQQNERLQAQIWGVGGGGSRGDVRSRLKQQTDAYGEASNAMVQKFNTMGLFFETLTQKFALRLFTAIGPDIDKLNKSLLQMQPHLEALFNLIIRYAPDAIAFLRGFITALGTWIDLLINTIDWIGKLPPAVKDAAEAMLALKVGIQLLSSPLGRFLALFTLFMLALDDYQQWQKNQETGSTVKTAFDWGGFDKIAKSVTPMVKEFDDWVESMTGLKGAFEWLLGAGIAAFFLGLVPKVNMVTGSIRGLSWAVRGLGLLFTTAGGGVLAGILAMLGLGGLAGHMNAPVVDEYGRPTGGTWGGKPPPAPDKSREGQGPEPGLITGKTIAEGIGGWLKRTFPLFSTDNSSGPAYGTVDETKAPVTKTDKKTIGILETIGKWGKETAEGIGELIRHNEMVFQDASEGLAAGLTPEQAAAAGGVAQAGSALTGGGPMTTQQAMSAADLRDDIAQRLNIPPEQASEIVSAMKFESGLRSDIRFGGGAYDVGGTDAVGLAQWTGSRHKALEAFANQRKMDPRERETQLQFMVYELNNNPAFARWREALAMHNWGGFYEASSGNLRAADPWQHGRSTLEISRLPSNARRQTSAADGPGGRQLAVNNTASIVVQSPDPTLAGHKVYAEMTRVFDFQTRYSQSRLA
jgi:hypothetical protein